jgi:PAS domain S-box-containing protein
VSQTLESSYRILAVDDDQSMLTLYRDILCVEGEEPAALEALVSGEELPEAEPSTLPSFELDVAGGAHDAVECVQQAMQAESPYAVILLDIRMESGPDGVWAAERIRELDQAVQIVMLTGHTDVTLRELNLRVPPAERLLYLHKPFRPQELRQLALSLCGKWSTEKQLKEMNEKLKSMVEARTAELYQANLQLKRDIAERVRMMGKLSASEERYRQLFEDDITGNFLADPTGGIVACNRSFARMFGYASPEEATAFNVLALEFDDPQAESLQAMVFRRRKIEHFEARFKRGNLPPVHVVGNVVGRFDEDGSLAEIRGYFFDITEMKKLEEQLRLAQKMEALGTLAGGIAHDFNNILGVIMGYAEIVLDSVGEDNPSMERKVQEIMSAGSRARDLVRQILNFSRQGPQEKKPLKITPLLKETVKFLRSSTSAAIDIRESVLTDEDTVTADATQIHQIILNLGANAAHAMAEHGGVMEFSLVEAEIDENAAETHPDLAPGRYVRLSLSDTGHGMEPEVVERIFDPFFTTKSPGEGTGMGLAVVHGIVKAHGGAVLVRSEPGRGTTFHIFLPRTASLAQQEMVPKCLFPAAGGRALYVDDEKPLVDVAVDLLDSLGFTAEGRTSSVEALEAFRHRSQDFDLVIADQSMPNMSGLELAKELIAIRPDIPVVLATGFSEAVSVDKARAAGVRDLLLKPILKQQLAQCLCRVLQ